MPKKYAVPKKAITEAGLKRALKDAIKDSSYTEWSIKHGITPQSVSAFMRKTQTPGLKIPEALGYRPQTIYLPLVYDLISTPPAPRRATNKPSKKVDHTKQPVEKKGNKALNDREETRKRLKERKK